MKSRTAIKTISVLLILLMTITIVITGCGSKAEAVVSTEITDKPSDNQEKDTTGEEKKQSEEEKEELTVEPEQSHNILYTSASKLNVREQPLVNSPKIDSLIKGSSVKVMEETTDENNMLWYKITYEGVMAEHEGWIAGEYTVKDRYELLDESLRNLDFSPQNKVHEYPNNKKVEAKGIYLTIYSASNSRLDYLIELSKRTSINTFVIDVKDDSGYMLFPTKASEKYSPNANKKATIKNISELMKKLKDNNIYAIARIVSFKDPTYTKHHPDRAIIYKSNGKPFSNSDGLVWASAHDRNLWEYNLEVAKEAAEVGFNEIQFDYVRFPASNGGKLDKVLDYGNTKNESKPETIQNYLKYARQQLKNSNVYISADIYGLVGSVSDDMALGQYWEAVSNVVDYVCPMMYPSHYANGTYGISIPDAFPYETIYRGVKDAITRNKNIQTPATIRPWIQDFTARWVKGHIKYGDKQVEEQIKALEDNGVKEFLLWNAGNTYSEGGL